MPQAIEFLVMLTKCFESGLVSSDFNAKRAYKDPENLLKTLRGKQPVLLSLHGEVFCYLGTSAAFADFHGRKTLLDKSKERRVKASTIP